MINCRHDTHLFLPVEFHHHPGFVVQDKIQSVHWNQGQVTLYTSVSRFRDQVISHVVVSDYMHHNKTSAVVFSAEVLAELPPDVRESLTHIVKKLCIQT